MADEVLRVEGEGAVRTLTIDRPKQLNALNEEVLRELLRALRELRRDREARAVILTGAGEKAFCAGADIEAMSRLSPAEARDLARLGQRVTTGIEDLTLPVIAAVNGFALGGGLEMAMACDIILASDQARFGQPEILLGLIPGFGGTQRLPRRIGVPQARELVYRGNRIDAETALRLGLVNRVVPGAELLDTARQLAAELAERPALALAQAKEAIRLGVETDLETGLRFEAEAFGVAFSSPDRDEGMRAFLEKRKANFRR